MFRISVYVLIAGFLVSGGFLAGFLAGYYQPKPAQPLRESSPSANPMLGGQIRWDEAQSYQQQAVRRELRYARQRVAALGRQVGEELELSAEFDQGHGFTHPNLTMSALWIPVTVNRRDDAAENQRLEEILEGRAARGFLLVFVDGHSVQTKLVIAKKLWLWRDQTGEGYRELEADIEIEGELDGTAEKS